MKYSKLKNDLEILELQHKHKMAMFHMEFEQEKRELLSSCTHKYEDGSSAKQFEGHQRDPYYVCDICGKEIK